MSNQLIIDDRKDPSHIIRSELDRRREKVQFQLLKVPFLDSDGILVRTDRRSGLERRNN